MSFFEVWERSGMWYYGVQNKRHNKTTEVSKSSTSQWDAKDETEGRAFLACLWSEEDASPVWLQRRELCDDKKELLPIADKDGGADSDQVLADDTDMQVLQACHDSTTKTTLAIKRLAPELNKIAKTGVTAKIASEALTLLKTLVEPGDVVEQLLMSERKDVTKQAAENALLGVGKPFSELMELHKQMTTTYNRLMKEAKSKGAKDVKDAKDNDKETKPRKLKKLQGQGGR